MSDEEHESAGSGEEGQDDSNDIGKRHRKEQKELTARIQALKKSVPKGDAKRKKAVAAEIEKITAELNEKQKKELEEHKKAQQAAPAPAADTAAADPADAALDETSEKQSQEPAKPTRAQRRRDKKETETQERTKRIAEAKHKGPTEHDKEMKKILEQLQPLSLRVDQIPSDGHCLFRAVASQLSPSPSVSDLRARVAAHMLANQVEFAPFVMAEDGEASEEHFKEHCNRIATTSEWGGQPELRAIAELLQRHVRVFQASGPMSFGNESDPPINVTFHRHQYHLGEHYNAAVPGVEEEED
eukprot:m.6349 g.6349  ORF g.6349 m.6349 type:complete len:300 (+) comp4754_c0_seq1:50-949(+)